MSQETETLTFQAEVSRLLDIVAHALYSDRQVFLRELISNASDACDRLRYAALTEPSLVEGDGSFRIRVIADKEAKTLTVSDNGIGMARDELVENLGTIARSGTARFVEALGEKKDLSLIGQFGVGFYAAFMVADRVEVTSRRAGSDAAFTWASDGKGQFTLAGAEKDARGTDIVLHLKEDAAEFLEEHKLREIVEKYSDHIAVPVFLGAGDDAPRLNRAAALWMRPKAEVTEDEYAEFYRHVAHAFDTPWLTLHWRAEGVIEYAALLFVPESRPFDLFDPRRAHGVKLYVRRVFITEAVEGLVPPWLRFLRGVVDSEDLPLNISREMLQLSPVVAKIRAGLVKRVLSELTKKAEDGEAFAPFWEAFGAVVKEGLYEDPEHREALLKLARFRSTHGEGLVSLADYVGRMKPGQEAIFTLAGEDEAALARSPQLEGFRAKGVEVLLLTDPVDEFWPPSVNDYEGKPFRSVTRAGGGLDKIDGAAPKAEAKPDEDKATTGLIARLKAILGDAVKDVRVSERLTDSPVCLVSDEGDLDIHLERLLKAHKRLDETSRRVLEINPAHPLLRRLAERAEQGEDDGGALDDQAWLLLDQALILEGEPLPDPAAFARRMAGVMERGL